jgi:hypothetical protein
MKKCFALILLLIAVPSCSPRFIYPHLEWLIPWYINDYISLDERQKNMLEQRLLKQLDWHCRTQLTTYAEILRAIGRDFASDVQPIEYSKVRLYHDRLMKLWKGLLQQIGPDITDILLTASDAQVAELFGNLEKQNQKLKNKYVDLPLRRLNAKRQRRMVERLEYWISNLTGEQVAAVSAWSAQLVPTAEDWLHNRELIQAEAQRLLARAKIDPQFRMSLQELIINPERTRSPAYQEKIDVNTDFTIRLIMRLDQMLTPGQRSYLLKRIESLAADLDKLSCDPKDLPNRGLRFQGSGY